VRRLNFELAPARHPRYGRLGGFRSSAGSTMGWLASCIRNTQAMKNHTRDQLLKLFHRESDGSWTSVDSVELVGPSGGRMQVPGGLRFRPGKPFMNVDMAVWLDQATA
jgi:hypothetical protein